ncbi:MAG: DUF3052 family protein [Candidatus Lambdaproteobacteria bacterium]|nr:DUF3052 family protein [Candidatus Lambdaproteobacteria bacterium]
MAGYSGTPLWKKLGIKPGARVAIENGPPGFVALLDPLPEGVRLDAPRSAGAQVIVFFTKRATDLGARLGDLAREMDRAGGLWIAWPKRASRVATDLTEDVIRAMALAAGLVDNKVCAIDETWSGLRLVWRLKDRKAGVTSLAP